MTEAILLSNATTCVGSAPYLIATHFDAISLIIARIRRNVPDAKSGVSNGHATDAVVVESHENFRSPRSVVKTINFFGLTQETILARSTYSGDQPEIVRYDGEESLITHTAAAITRYLEKGFEPNEIVVLSMRGLKNSVLVRSKIGVHDMVILPFLTVVKNRG